MLRQPALTVLKCCILILFWQAVTLSIDAQPALPLTDQIRALAWSPDGSQIAIGYQNGLLKIVSSDLSSNVRTLQEASENGLVSALSWSSDGQMLASGTGLYEDILTVWDANTSEPVLVNNSLSVMDILSVEWSPDNTQVLVTAAEPTNGGFASILVHIPSNETRGVPSGSVTNVEWSPDGTRIVLSQTSNIVVLDAASLETIARYPIEQTVFRSNFTTQPIEVIWKPDGTQLAVGMGDGRIFILSNQNPNTLELVTPLIAHEYNGDDRRLGFVWGLSFTADGAQLTSISGDGTIRTWETLTWQVVQEAKTVPNYAAEFTQYGGRAVIGAVSHTAGTPPESEIQILIPAPTFDRLNAIAEMCVRDAPTPSRAVTGLASQPVASLDALPDFIAQVEALPADAIPPACRADLLAVAGALR